MQRDSGFTLIEILVGILIFFVISSTLFLLLQSVISVREQQQLKEDAGGQQQRILDDIARELEYMVPQSSNACEMVLAESELAFCSLHDPAHGLIELRYRLDGRELERVAIQIGRGGETNTILGGVSTFEVFQLEDGEETQSAAIDLGTNSFSSVPPLLMLRLGGETPVERLVFLPLSLSAESRLQRQ